MYSYIHTSVYSGLDRLALLAALGEPRDLVLLSAVHYTCIYTYLYTHMYIYICIERYILICSISYIYIYIVSYH